MPLNLSKVLQKTAEVKAEWEEEEISITYRVGQYTARYLNMLDENQNFSAAQMVVDLVEKWDLMDDTEGKPTPIPIDKEHIERLPISLNSAIIAAIMKDQASPNQNKQTN